MGHRVVAAEPTDELRVPGMALHPSPRIEWLKDSLPDLAVLRGRDETFDLVMLTGVGMHLDALQRRQAMRTSRP